MSGPSNLVIKPWALPLIVLALVVPGSVGFILAGPGVGLALGALSVATVIFVAVRQRPDEPIEVAAAADQRRRLLLVAVEPVDQPAAVEGLRVAAHAASGTGAEAVPGARGVAEEGAEILALVPALNAPLDRWASDVGRSRLDAQRKLVLTLGALAAAEVDARGAVGDPDPLQAVEDTLREFAADEVIVALPDREQHEVGALVAELRRRLDMPVYPLSSSSPIRSAR